MRKALKIGAILVGVVVALLVILVIVATVVIDPNRYRDDIIKVVKDQTGRDLKIEGKLGLSFFPWIGLETGRLQLSNAPGFGPEPFALVDSAGIKVQLLPLFRKQVVVDAVRLNGLKLHLARAADGRTNWADLAKSETKPAPQQPPSQPTDARAAAAIFTVNRVEVRNSEFTWRDQTSGAAYAAKRVELASGNILGSTPVPLRLAFDIESAKPKITRRVELDAKLNADLAGEKLNIPELRASTGDLQLRAQLQGTEVLRDPKFQGRVELPPFNLRALLQELQIAYAPTDGNALKKVGLVAQLGYSAQAMSVSDLRLTLDDSALTGKLTAQRQPRASYRFDFALDNIDVDRYLPPSQKSSGDGKAAAGKGNAEAVVIPLALLRDAEADGQFRVQKLKAFGIRSEQVVLKVAAHGGRIALGPNEARLYGGVYAGRTTLDASGKTPQLRLEEKLTDVQLGPFLKDAQLFDKFSGAGNVTLNLTGQGLDADAIKRTLNGSVAVAVKDGAIEGVDLGKIEAKIKEVRDQPGGTARNLLTSLPAFTPSAGDKTPFTKLQASAAVNNGVVSNKDLAIQASRLNVTGSGNINLVTDMYENYILRVNNFPLVVSGKLAEPKISPDWNAIVKGQTEQKIEQKKEEVRDILRERLREKFKR